MTMIDIMISYMISWGAMVSDDGAYPSQGRAWLNSSFCGKSWGDITLFKIVRVCR
jgi:hypothetical protein